MIKAKLNSFANWCLELGEKTLATVDADDNKIDLNDEEEQTLVDIFDGRNVEKSIKALLQKVSHSRHQSQQCDQMLE